MPRLAPKLLAILPLAAAAMASAASAYDPIVEEQGWPQLAYDRDNGCEAEIRGNGKVFLVNAVGLGAGASGRYRLTNEDMEPIDWSIVANGEGRWNQYYVPFLPEHDSGTVRISIATRDCSLSLSFVWDTYIPENDWASRRAMLGG